MWEGFLPFVRTAEKNKEKLKILADEQQLITQVPAP
jgi:hypothetical protein